MLEGNGWMDGWVDGWMEEDAWVFACMATGERARAHLHCVMLCVCHRAVASE